MRDHSLLRLVLPTLLLLGACRVEPVEPPGGPGARDNPTPRVTGDRRTDAAILQRLEEEARALARTEGCASAGECRSLPVGAKACGGPRYFLPYCPLTTDEEALRAKLARIEAFERAFNQRYRIVSTCELATPPALELSGGACRATGRSAPPGS